MAAPTRIALVGAGLIGRRHAEAIRIAQGVDLAAVADPTPAGAEVAAAHGVPHFPTLEAMVAAGSADGVILATPNQLHTEQALACIGAGLPTLVEKPLADSLDGARAIVEAADAAGVPVLTGHHRRHNPLIAKAHEVIASGTLGQMTAVHGQTWFLKPEHYFEADWRRQKGAGPVYLNLIHDIDLLRHLCGEVETVHAMESNAVRGNEVEETAVILLRFANGALGTVNVSDATLGPWSWELTARENPAYPATSETCYWIGGTQGSLALPNLALWQNPAGRSWWEPISATRLPHDFADPLVVQAAHFGAVIRGEAAPLVSAREGYRSLAVIEAVKLSAARGKTVEVGPLL